MLSLVAVMVYAQCFEGRDLAVYFVSSSVPGTEDRTGPLYTMCFYC